MPYYIKATDYSVNEDGILVIYDKKQKKVHKKIKIFHDKLLKIEDDYIIKNITNHNFVFKIRSNDRPESKNLTKYFYLVNKQNLTDYWLGNINMSETEILNHIYYFSNDEKYLELKNSFIAIYKKITMNFNSDHSKLESFIKYSEDKKLTLLFENITTYLKYLLKIKTLFKEKQYIDAYFDDLYFILKQDEHFYESMVNILNKLEVYDLQFIYYMKGHINSLLGDREKAAHEFKKADSYSNDYGLRFSLGIGTSTYISNIREHKIEPTITFFDKTGSNNKLETIVLSLEENFLRSYGLMIINNIISLRKYHFHVHVVGRSNKVIKLISELELIFDQAVKFFDKSTDVYQPSFSYEFLPNEITDINTYSACARFIHANEFIDRFSSNLYIMDADCLIIDNLEPYSRNFKGTDIGIAFSRSLSPLMPWKRLMAGDSYFSNTSVSKEFLNLTRDYILSNVHKEKAWTLDQNALAYAYEKMANKEKSVIKNIYKIKRPFLHAKISNLIEKP